MTQVEVLVEDDRWKIINFEDLVTKAFYETLKRLGYSKTDYFISVLGCNDKKMRKLNLMFRSKDTSTNVLSWPSRERLRIVEGDHPKPLDPTLDAELGDIALAYETCLRESTHYNTNFASYVQHLTIHGILHLIGYDHSSDPDATLMEDLESEILGNLSLKAHT